MTSSPPSQPPQSAVEAFLHRLLSTERNVVVLVVSENNQVLDYDLRPMADVVTLLDASGFGKPIDPNAPGILHQLIPA